MQSWEDELLERLYRAYDEARKGKRRSPDMHTFELNDAENLTNLCNTILARRYKPGRGIAFVTMKPVIREIFAAPFVDRVVHHFLFDVVSPWWDRHLIYDSYSCRYGKGTLMGIKRMQHHMRCVSQNGTRPAYVVKLDISGYFMNLSRQKLFERVVWGLDQQFPGKGKLYDVVKYLWREVIFDDPTKGVRRKGPTKNWQKLPATKSLFCQPEGRGIVIGNLSSQLLSNIYLDQLDRYMTFRLGYKHYGRYVDDFYMVVTEQELPQAKRDIAVIEQYLRSELELELHPYKRMVIDVRYGVPFLGAVIYADHLAPGKRVRRNFVRAAREVATGEREIESVVSYLGHMSYMRSKKLESDVFEELGWDYTR